MLEDELLKRKLRRGSTEALARVYEKYLDSMLTLAMGLLHNTSEAQDVVQDVFVSFVRCVGDFQVHGSLRAYLATSVANQARDHLRHRRRQPMSLAEVPECPAAPGNPLSALSSEESRILLQAVSELPYEQCEAITLHLHGGMTFREIARNQGVSINTAQSRYRYGIDKLRTTLSAGVRP